MVNIHYEIRCILISKFPDVDSIIAQISKKRRNKLDQARARKSGARRSGARKLRARKAKARRDQGKSKRELVRSSKSKQKSAGTSESKH